MSKKKKQENVLATAEGGFSTYAVTKGGKLIKLSDNREIVTDPNDAHVDYAPKGTDKIIEWAMRGRNNDLPYNILRHVGENVTVGSNIGHKEKIVTGDGIMVYRKTKDESGNIVKTEVLADEAPEIFDFILYNDYDQVRQEIANDLIIFGDSYVEYSFSKDKDAPKLVQVRALEAACSRISIIDEKAGRSLWHGYSAKWHNGMAADDLVATPLLSRISPLYDLLKRMGKVPDVEGLNKLGKDRVFVHNLRISSPGRFYYSKPYWWSIFTSGWFDFAAAIPIYKKSLIKNQMAIKYMVYIKDTFWEGLYREQGIPETDKKKRAAARQEFLTSLEAYLTGQENAGKSFVSHFRYDKVKGFEDKDVLITPLKNEQAGGEYIEDSEEVSNTICYAMGVHPSIIGASPGKSKSINGTEARELFIIEQAMMKRYQELTLQPLYVAKALNGWPDDIFFSVTNVQLTTLDKGTGAVKNTGLKPDTED